MRMYPVKYSSPKPVLLYNYEFYGLIIISANKIKQHSFSLQFMNLTVSIFCKKEKKKFIACMICSKYLIHLFCIDQFSFFVLQFVITGI